MKIIKLMADYQCFPLWNVSPGSIGNIDPNELPLSSGLKDDLFSWGKFYDETLNEEYPPDSGFRTRDEENRFNKDADKLVERLREELGGGYCVVKG